MGKQLRLRQRRMRFDAVPIGKARRTPQGGIRAPASPTCEGIFEYENADGTIRREYHPADVVFSAATLESLTAAPLTIGHPPVPVTLENWDAYAVGHVGDQVERDGEWVVTEIVAQHATAVAGLESGDLSKLSCSYEIECREQPGVWKGRAYDAIATSIEYNHLALLRKHEEPRAGAMARVRLDSKGNAIPEERGTQETKTMRTIRIDGIDFPADSDAAIQAFAKYEERYGLVVKGLAEARTDAEKEKARADAAEAELAKAKKEAEEASDPKRVEALVVARAALRTDAAKLLGDADLSGKTDREVMEAAVLASDPEAKLEGSTDEYVKARFDAALSYGSKPAEGAGEGGVGSVRRAALDAIKKGQTDEDPVEDLRLKMEKGTQDAWKQPHGATLKTV